MKFSLIFAILGFILFLFLGYMHEQVHVTIYEHYGINSTVDYIHHFPDLATIPDRSCPNEACILANNQNEIIGYQLQPFYIMIYFGFLFIMLIIESRRYDCV